MALPISELLEPTGVPILAKIQGLPKGTIYTVGDENPIDIEFVSIRNETSGFNLFQAGRGALKSAYYVKILSGPDTGKHAVLITPIISRDIPIDNIPVIFNNQLEAHELGYAPKPYTYTTENGGIIVSEIAKGENICRLNGNVTIEQQLALLKATLTLHSHNLYQEDINCGNYYVNNNDISIIDDISKRYDYTLIDVFTIIKNIQRLSSNRSNLPLREFAHNMYANNYKHTYIKNAIGREVLQTDFNTRVAPLKGLTPEEITDIGEDFYNRAMEMLHPYDNQELAKTIKQKNTYFRLNDTVYKYILDDSDNTIVCKRLEITPAGWSADEHRIEISTLQNIPQNGIFRCPSHKGGGIKPSRKTRKNHNRHMSSLPIRRKNVRKSVRRKHT